MAIGSLVAFADPMRARTNIAAFNLINQVNSLNREIAVRQLRLATGKQQPRMEDGASFFAIFNKMKNQVRGKTMALDNVSDAKDELSLAEAGLLRVDELLGRMRDLTIRAANDTLTPEQRDDVRQEFFNLFMGISEVVKRTRFNEGGEGGVGLLDGFRHTYQVGPNESELDKLVVEIPDMMAEIVKELFPEMDQKVNELLGAMTVMPDDVRTNIAEEIKSFAGTLASGNVRDTLEVFGEAFKSGDYPVDFLNSLGMLNEEDAAKFYQELGRLYETRLNTSAASPAFKDFVTDADLRGRFTGLAPLIGVLLGNQAVDTVANGLQGILDLDSIKDADLKKALIELRDSVRGVNQPYKTSAGALDTLIDSSMGPSQRLFLAQDLAFFAASDAEVTKSPNVQNALGQLALDIANNVDGLPSFTGAMQQLTPAERDALKKALARVSTDTRNGLAFHAALPNLDGTGGPFSQSDGTFAKALVNIEKTIPIPEHVALAATLQGVANALALPSPIVANRVRAVIPLLLDGKDDNDPALAEALSALGEQIEKDTGSFFLNPVARSRIRQGFAAQFNTDAFKALSPALQAAFKKMADDIITVTDINGANGPFSQSANTFAKLAVGLAEVNPPTAAAVSDSMASLLQGVATTVTAATPNVANKLKDVATLLKNPNATDAQLAAALTALGQQIETDTGGETNINGPARAALRQAFLEQAATPTFNSLPIALKAVYLQMSEALGAYTANQVLAVDAKLKDLAGSLTPDTSNLGTKLGKLADELSDKAVTGEERNAVIQGLAGMADSLESFGNQAAIVALRDAIDGSANDTQTNPGDLVGALKRHIPDALNQALKALLVPGQNNNGSLSSVTDRFMNLFQDDSTALITGVDNAINSVKDQLITLGGIQTKLTGLENLLSDSIVAEDSVASRFGDADLAKEQVELTKLNLFSQLANAQAAAANVFPSQLISSLLGGGR